jgi:hypothetical protein
MNRLPLFLAITAAAIAQNSPKFPGAVATNQDLLIARNQGETTLTSAINSVTLSIPVTSGSVFTAPLAVTIGNEAILVCSIASNTLTVCSGGRGFDGTSAVNHANGRPVQARVVAWHHNQSAAEIRAVETKLHGENVSVKDFGALGDGVTVDTVAIQAAIDSLSPRGGDVYFPKGVYIIGAPISVPSYTRLHGVNFTRTRDNITTAGIPTGSVLKANGAFNILIDTPVADGRTYSVTIDHLAFQGTSGSGSRGIYATHGPDGWTVTNTFFDTFGDECMKIGGDSDGPNAGVDGYFSNIFAQGCLTVRSGRSAYIGAVDIGVDDAVLHKVEATASVIDGAQPFPGQGLIGSGYIAGIVSRGSTNFLTNCIGHVSQVGIVIQGQGPHQVIGNRADFNQGYGFIIRRLASQVVLDSNLSFRNSRTADGAYSAFRIETGENAITNNRAFNLVGTDTGSGGAGAALPRMKHGFEDAGPGGINTDVSSGNYYAGNRVDALQPLTASMYDFSGGNKKHVIGDPNHIAAQSLAIPQYGTDGNLKARADEIMAFNSEEGLGTRLSLRGGGAITISAATGANPMVLTLASAPPAEFKVGAPIVISGATSTAGVNDHCASIMNGLQTISAIAGSVVTISLDATSCTYLANSAITWAAALSSIEVENPSTVASDILLSGKLGSLKFRDKRANANAGRWEVVTNTDGATYNNLLFRAVNDAQDTFSNFMVMDRAISAVTASSVTFPTTMYFTTLMTTGSAGSKKVVCVDTATGRIYASSTSTDCSN